ncbi:MAG: 4-hydroxy-tetrahydrodipicolinate reductase [Longimicrobiales bacterium]
MSHLRIALIGNGRMGHAIRALAHDAGADVVAVIGSAGNEDGRAITTERLAAADVAIEVSVATAAAANAIACVEAGVPVVVGTTGWLDRMADVSAVVERVNGALLWAPNFSPGVVLFTALVEQAARLYGHDESFAAHIIETHHAAKNDAPSGTALALAETFEKGAGRRPGISSVRIGHVPGTHEILFDAAFEQVRLVHAARDRRVFAAGALRAAAWLAGRRGIYTMRDVLGLTREDS